MKKEIITGWICEEDFFARRRAYGSNGKRLEIIEKKWSTGNSPQIMVKAGFIHREEWEKCFWYDQPSYARCNDWGETCEHSDECDHYIETKRI